MLALTSPRTTLNPGGFPVQPITPRPEGVYRTSGSVLGLTFVLAILAMLFVPFSFFLNLSPSLSGRCRNNTKLKKICNTQL